MLLLAIGWLLFGERLGLPGPAIDQEGEQQEVAQQDGTRAKMEVPPLRALDPVREPVKKEPAPVPGSVPEPPALDLDVLPGNRELRRGLSTSIHFELQRRNCKGPVEVTVEGLPSTILVKPAQIAAEDKDGSIQLTPNLNAHLGAHSARLKASLDELVVQKEFKILVNEYHPVAPIELSTVNAWQFNTGETEQIEVELKPAAPEPLVLALTHLPAGATASPVAVAKGQARVSLKLELSASALAGTKEIKVAAYRLLGEGMAQASLLGNPIAEKTIDLRISLSPYDVTPIVVMQTNVGDITLLLFADKAPQTVSNFLDYAEAGHYDGTSLTKSDGYVMAGEDKRSTKPRWPVTPNESGNGLSHQAGTIALVRTTDANFVSAQFFFNLNENPQNDRGTAKDGVGWCVFGRIITGWQVFNSIRASSLQGYKKVVIESVRRLRLPRDASTERLLRDIEHQGELRFDLQCTHIDGQDHEFAVELNRPAVSSVTIVFTIDGKEQEPITIPADASRATLELPFGKEAKLNNDLVVRAYFGHDRDRRVCLSTVTPLLRFIIGQEHIRRGKEFEKNGEYDLAIKEYKNSTVNSLSASLYLDPVYKKKAD
ncbi:MAG: peptidylprolyl isomerase, partial [Gemmataceae bacterium]